LNMYSFLAIYQTGYCATWFVFSSSNANSKTLENQENSNQPTSLDEAIPRIVRESHTIPCGLLKTMAT
jgi:hypothetical protein